LAAPLEFGDLVEDGGLVRRREGVFNETPIVRLAFSAAQVITAISA
jgi:hypothetical protein